MARQAERGANPWPAVTLLAVTPWPLCGPGGAERLTEGLTSSLATNFGLDVVVAAGSGAPGTPSIPVRSTPSPEIRLPLVHHPAAGWRLGRRRHGLLTEMRLDGLEDVGHSVRPQAVLYTSHYSSCAEQAAALARCLAVPLVILPAIHLDDRWHTGRLARRFYASAALVLVLSVIERDWIVGHAGLPPHRVVTLGYGWDGPVGALRPAWAPPQPLRLLTVSAYARHKQLDHQVEAVAMLRNRYNVDARLTVAGALRVPGVLERLRGLARRLGIDEAIRFLPDCTDAATAELHATSDLFLFTSGSESFGVAVLEAIASGTPPVVYPHPVYRSLVESSGFGMVAKRPTPRALAEAVIAALGTPVATSQESRLRWLATQSWRQLVDPFGRWLSDFAKG